jgi:hypothetical protein
VAEDRVRRRANKYSKAAGKPGRDGVSYWRKAEPALRDGE